MDKEIFKRNLKDPIEEFIDSLELTSRFEPISSKHLDQREFNQVLDLVRKRKNPQHYKIGVIRPDLPRMDKAFLKEYSLKSGQVILYSNEDKHSATIEALYCAREIERRRNRGSLIDSFIITDFLKRYFQPIG